MTGCGGGGRTGEGGPAGLLDDPPHGTHAAGWGGGWRSPPGRAQAGSLAPHPDNPPRNELFCDNAFGEFFLTNPPLHELLRARVDLVQQPQPAALVLDAGVQGVHPDAACGRGGGGGELWIVLGDPQFICWGKTSVVNVGCLKIWRLIFVFLGGQK